MSHRSLAWLVARLRVGGFTLLDCQFMTPHLASLGAIEMSGNALTNGSHIRIEELATDVSVEQTAEIRRMQQMQATP